MKKFLLKAGFATFAFMLFACQNKYEKMVSELDQNYLQDGKQIEMEGYLFPKTFSMVGNHVTVDLCATSDPTVNRDIITGNVELLFGKSANSMFFPEKYEMKDVALFDKDGKKLNCSSDKVKITGTVVYTAKGPKKVTVNKMMPEFMQKKQKEEAKEAEGKNDYTYMIKDIVITKI